MYHLEKEHIPQAIIKQKKKLLIKNYPSVSEVNSSFCNDGEYLLSVVLSQINKKAMLYKMKSQKKTYLVNRLHLENVSGGVMLQTKFKSVYINLCFQCLC